MPEITELTTDGKLTLPGALAAQFHPSDRFLVWADGDTVHFKRITRPRLTDLVAEAPVGQPLSPEEISEEVHEYRRRKHSG